MTDMTVVKSGKWQAEVHEEWSLLSGPGLRVGEGARLSFHPKDVLDVLAVLQQVRQHPQCEQWHLRGGRFPAKPYGRVALGKDHWLVVDSNRASRDSGGATDIPARIPHGSLEFLLSALGAWIDPEKTQGAAAEERLAAFAGRKHWRKGSLKVRPTFELPIIIGFGDWQTKLLEDHLLLSGGGLRIADRSVATVSIQQVEDLYIALKRASRHPVAQSWYHSGGSSVRGAYWSRETISGRLHIYRRKRINLNASGTGAFYEVEYSELGPLIRCLKGYLTELQRKTDRKALRDDECHRRGCHARWIDPLSRLCQNHFSQQGGPVNIVHGGGMETNRRRH